MKKALLTIAALLSIATATFASETATMTPTSVKASRCAVGTESGDAWTGNDASNPIYCSITSGGFSSSGLATAANQTTTNTSLGATNETAASTDTGTFSLIALTKRIAQRLTSILTALSDGTQVVKGIPPPCASAPLTKLYQTTASRRSMTISLGATYTWARVTNLDTTKQVGIRLTAADTDPEIIPSGGQVVYYPAAGVANLYADTSTTPASGGSTTYLAIYACP